jgi:hydrogenase maturation protease
MNNLLVIGYGNTIRSDDGAGPAAAKAIRDRYPDVDCIAVHGLEPVLAETIGHYECVVFIDAAVGIDSMSISAVTPSPCGSAEGTHTHSPESLLRLSIDLYNKTPEVLTFRLPAYHMEFGEIFSAATGAALKQCVDEFGKRFAGSFATW